LDDLDAHGDAKLDLTEYIDREIQESIAVNTALAGQASKRIAQAASAIVTCLRAGGKLVVFGNGGSAADAQHLAAELVGRYQIDRTALAAIALTTDSSALTAIGNDFGFAEIFSRQLEAIGKPGDVALAISTSGNSANVLHALKSARRLKMGTIGLSGKTGGQMRGLVDICLCAPSELTPRIQEAHILIIHVISGIVENSFVTGRFAPDSQTAKAGSRRSKLAGPIR
jgi:D-sedoheptulose 7-phosphate isomerase